VEKFIVKHYSSDKHPSIKGNGFDGTLVGDDREDAEEFIGFVNDLIETIKILDGGSGEIIEAFVNRRVQGGDFRPFLDRVATLIEEVYLKTTPDLSIQNPNFLDNLKKHMYPCYGDKELVGRANCASCVLKDVCLEGSTK